MHSESGLQAQAVDHILYMSWMNFSDLYLPINFMTHTTLVPHEVVHYSVGEEFRM
jgi:hypothetical protein